MNHLILIRHNRSIKANLPTSLLSKLDSVDTVWTDEACGQFIEKPNESFEFSGYQEGLLRILNKFNSSTHEYDNKKNRLVIANDTIFNGHLNILSTFVISQFISSSIILSNSSSICTGLVHSLDPDFKSIVQSSSYIPSWLFMLEGTYLELRNLYFYDKNLNLNNFSHCYYSTLPLPYRLAIDDWLEPSHFLRGWYQAAPGRKLPLATIDRKRFTIYLEHTLPGRLQASGFQIVCLSQRLGPAKKMMLSMLRLMDRFYVNLIKIRLRLWSKFFFIVNRLPFR